MASPELSFAIEGIEAVPYAATPQLALKTRIRAQPATLEIHNVLLRCQVQIEPAQRRYTADEQRGLGDLFGTPSRWSQTLRPLLWTNADLVVPRFAGEIAVDVPLPCTFDFNVAVTKYLAALEAGDVPLCALLSGTVFYATEEGLQVAQIPWDREMKCRMPTKVWRDMMDFYYPNTAWLCLRRDVFEQLQRYKTDRGLPTLERTMESLLAGVSDGAVRKVPA